MLQRELTRVIRDDPAGVDDYALDLSTFPEIAPPRDIVAVRVFFRDVGLPPAVGPAVPGFGGSGRGSKRRRSGCDELTSCGHAESAISLTKAWSVACSPE